MLSAFLHKIPPTKSFVVPYIVHYIPLKNKGDYGVINRGADEKNDPLAANKGTRFLQIAYDGIEYGF